MVGVSLVVAAIIIGVSVFLTTREDDEKVDDLSKQPVESLGATPAACDAITTTPTDGSQKHLPVDEQIIYPTAPPAYGPHWSQPGVAPAPFEKKFYTAQDRPELEALVHNLEHGYTILWYDESIAEDPDALDVVKAIAEKFRGANDLRAKFIAAPWTAEDVGESGAFPDGRHVAFSHWSAGGAGEEDPAKQLGVFQYCSGPSAAALDEFMVSYPYSDSPEPLAG